MGTEIFPMLKIFANVVVATIFALSLFVIFMMSIDVHRHPHDANVRANARKHILNALTAILIALIAYVIVHAIGPAFTVLFTSTS